MVSLNNQLKSRKKKAFTLIELLVVIAIIALLLSIMMPALQKVKKQAQNVVCKSNLRQWGLTWKMYTEDNTGKFPNVAEANDDPGFGTAPRSWWAACLASYLGKDNRGRGIYFCPAATRDPHLAGSNRAADEFTSYRISTRAGDLSTNLRSSYGLNCWTYNNTDNNDQWSSLRWKKDAGLNNSRNIPVLLDCKWRGGYPLHTDIPLKSGDRIADADGDLLDGGGNVGEMCHFQMKRHKHGINAAFLDYSVRGVEPIELWSLKWHREFDTHYADSNITWEDWMD